MVITKLNGIVQSHAETKRDFIVERHVNDQGMIFMIKMLDNIINITPESLKGAIELMMDVDILKSDVTVKIDPTTGKISNIEDLNTKLFFDLFFNKYLVSDNKVFESYSRPYYSQLFDGEVVSLNYQQTINAESTDNC